MHGKITGSARKVKAGEVDFTLIRKLAAKQATSLVQAWLPDGKRDGDEWIACNPTRADDSPGSFKINLETGAWSDFATGDRGGDLIALRAYLDGSNQGDAARRLAGELGVEIKPAPSGLTLEAYAAAKRLPLDFLRKLGLETVADPWGKPRNVLSIPYRKRNGAAHRCRLRVAMTGETRMVWDKREEKLSSILYGLDQLPAKGCPLLLVEGESDAHTLWFHGFDAVAVPGAGNFSAARDDAELEGYDIIALIEPDDGGATLIKQLGKSRHRTRIRLARLEGFKDASELHLRAAERFEDVLRAAMEAAQPLETVAAPTPAPAASRAAKRSPASGEDEERRTIADTIVRLARDAATFFMSEDDTPFATIEVRGHREVWELNSKSFRRWMIHQFLSETGRAPSEDALSQARLTLEALAEYEGEKRPVRVRTAEHDGKIYIDLGDDAWRAIEVDKGGWRIVDRPPVYFTRSNGGKPLPEPARGGSIDELRPLLNLASEDDFKLIVGFLLAALRPKGPFPLLAVAGEPGTAKTSAATLLRGLIDPHVAGIRRPPKEERDLFIWASKTAILAYDNLSAIPEWFSDALCVVATGGTFASRSMRTNSDETLFTVELAGIITSVGEIISRSDLADRAIIVTLEVIPENKRMLRGELAAAIERAQPHILGALLDGLCCGLRNIAGIQLGRLPRMADFITWTQACETAYWDAGEIHNAFDRNMAEAVDGVLEGDAVCVSLRAWFAARNHEAWTGKPSALLVDLGNWAEIEAKRAKDWPKTPALLSSRLTLAAPALRKIGIVVQKGRQRTAQGVMRTIEVFMA